MLRSAMVAGLACAPLSAQTDQPPPGAAKDPEILVIGKERPTRAQLYALAARITTDSGPAQAMARFDGPVCFTSIGLPATVSVPFLKRLESNATLAGVAFSKSGCRPNLFVFFTEDGRSDIRLLRDKLPWLFARQTPFQIDRTLDEPGPVHSWTNVETLPSDGPGYIRESSILALTVRQDINSAVIFIDRDAAIGKTVRQLADYVTMRGLAFTRTPGLRDDDATILTLFNTDRRQSPTEMTPFDREYLKELYAGRPNMRAATKMRRIARRIEQATTEATGTAGDPAAR